MPHELQTIDVGAAMLPSCEVGLPLSGEVTLSTGAFTPSTGGAGFVTVSPLPRFLLNRSKATTITTAANAAAATYS